MTGHAGAGMLRENPQTGRRGASAVPAARRPTPRGPSPRRRRWAVAALAAFVPLVASGRGDAYRFLAADGWQVSWSTKDRPAVVSAADAVRWSAGVWGPGQTLVFEVTPNPQFEVLFDSPEDVIPYFERALAAWSDIPTADIRLRVDGVAEGNRNLNKLFLDPANGGHWGARAWDRFYSGKWERFLCDIALSSWYASLPDDLDPEELEETREARREVAVGRLVHEVGHCIGLQNAGTLSSTYRWVRDSSDWVRVHPRDPAMSRGYGRESADELTADDIAGASLLRPASSFRATTGTISGTLDLDGEPAPYVHVWALPLDGDPLRDRVGAFSDHEGAFLIEGLEPGGYALWAQPLHDYGAHPRSMRDESPLELDETIVGRPAWVSARRNTGPIAIPLRQGRVPRPRPDGVVARQDAEPPTSITGSWGSPCTGVRVRAEEEPFLADGPDARPVQRIGDARWYATTLTMEWSLESEEVIFDWASPYRDWEWDWGDETWEFFSRWRGSKLDVTLADWQIEGNATGSATHTAEIAWPENAEVRLRFRSTDDSCDGEPTVVCSVEGCGLSPGVSPAQ